MEERAYLEEEKKEKGEMKKRLWNWGSALEKFRWKEEELEKQQIFYEMQKKIWKDDETEKGRKTRERLEKEYSEQRGKIRIEMVEILREKAWVDDAVKTLNFEEKIFVEMRFEKGYGFDYISMKMHLSRATLFRMQDRVLGKMAEYEKEHEMPLRRCESRKKVC